MEEKISYICWMSVKMIPHDRIKDFIFAGKSIFTIKNPKTGNRFTFKIGKSKSNDLFFVSVLTSPDHYEFLGTIFPQNIFRGSNRSLIKEGSPSLNVFKWFISKMDMSSLPKFIEVWHEGCCARCGRRLTTPESIESGFGPECIKKSKNGSNN